MLYIRILPHSLKASYVHSVTRDDHQEIQAVDETDKDTE
jgi:hypothetical protein